MEVKNVNEELVIPVTLLDERQLRHLTVRSVKAFIVNHDLMRQAKRQYTKQFKFLRRHHIGPIVNDLLSVFHTMDGQSLFSHGNYHTDHNLLQYVYPGYGVTPFEKKIPLYRTYFPAIPEFTEDRNKVEVHIPKEFQVPGLYTLILKIEVEHTHRIHKDVWEITNEVGEFNILEPNYYFVYSEKNDDSAIVYAGESNEDIVSVMN